MPKADKVDLAALQDQMDEIVEADDAEETKTDGPAEEVADDVELESEDIPAVVEELTYGLPKPTNVIEAITYVTAAIGPVSKGGKAVDVSGGYKFRKIDDVIEAISAVVTQAGLVIVPQVIDHDAENVPMGVNKIWRRAIITVQYVLYGPKGVEDTILGPRVVADGLDNSDKSFGKALSYAYKGALSQLFHIAFEGMDNEATVVPDQIALPSANEELVSKLGRETIINALNGIEVDVEKSELRNRAKHEFVAQYGDPDQLTVSKFQAATKWVEDRLALIANTAAAIQPPAEKVTQGKNHQAQVGQFIKLMDGAPMDAVDKLQAWLEEMNHPYPDTEDCPTATVVAARTKLEVLIESADPDDVDDEKVVDTSTEEPVEEDLLGDLADEEQNDDAEETVADEDGIDTAEESETEGTPDNE